MKPRSFRAFIPFLSFAFSVASVHADTALSAGQNNIDTTGNPNLGTITRTAGATAFFNNGGTATAPGTSLSNGILGPWATIGSGTSTRYATLDGSNSVVGYSGATALSGTSPWGGIGSGDTSTTNYEVSSGGAFGLTGLGRSINTYRYTGSGATQQSNFGGSAGADIFTVNGIMNVGSGSLNIGSAATGTYNGLNILIGASQELALSAVTANIVVENIIKNNGSNPSAVTVTGGSSVILGGANTFSGGLFINSGNVERKLSGTLGTGPVNVGTGSTLTINGAAHTMSQAYSGAGQITNTVSNTVTGDFSGFTGTYTHNSTTVSSVFNTGVSTSANASYVLASPQGSLQGFIAAGAGDYTLQMGSLSGVADSMIRGGGFVTGTTTLEVGNLNTSTTFAGTITNGTAAVNPKILALTKVGNGTLTMGGANAYTGATTVSAGTLLVNGSLGNSAVSVNAGTLGGSGAIAGTVSVAGAGTLSAGNSIESLATGALTMASGSTYVFEASNNSATGADLVAVNGTLSLTNVTLSLDAATLLALSGGSWAGDNKLTLISYLDAGSGITSGFNGYVDGGSYFFGANEWIFDYNDTVAGANYASDAIAAGQNRFVTLTLVPEPSAALLAGLGALGLLRRRRSA